MGADRSGQRRAFMVWHVVLRRSLLNDGSYIREVGVRDLRKKMMRHVQRQPTREPVEPSTLRHDVKVCFQRVKRARRV